MIEGNGFDSPEAGPSSRRRPSYDDDQTPQMNGVSRMRDGDGDEEEEEVLRDEEVMFQCDIKLIIQADELERHLSEGSRQSNGSDPPSFDLTSSPTLPASHRVHTPASTDIRHRPRPVQHKSSSNAPLSPLALHTTSSAIFDHPGIPPLSRRTTYSSLPPSPGLEIDLDFSRGVGKQELEEVLERLNAKAGPATARLQDVKKKGEESWSVRPTSETANVGNAGQGDGTRSDSPEGKKRVEASGIWDLLKDELGAEDWDGWVVDGKWERISNFLAVPMAVEKVTVFGCLLCLDGFLYNFTILPIRASFAASRMVQPIFRRQSILPIPPSHLHSLLRMMLLFIPTLILLLATDASKMYHTVRGQDTIKLYVIFNALEIADRLCCAFGQDVLDTVFARETLAPSHTKHGRGRRRQQARPAFFFMLSLGYVLVHTLIFFYMLVSLNVAINSYDYTLLSLLISNQFVEIKGSVFKKFEKENLFQIMCADIVERFQLGLMLCVIALRNMIEMAGSDIAFLPKSFIQGKSLVDSILSPVLFVIISEILVDWLKHAFITKFNHVRASVYGRFTDVLAKDVLLAGSLSRGRSPSKGRTHPVLLDQSPLVARRLGFASIPLACLVIRIGAQAIGMLTCSSHVADDLSMTRGGLAWRVVMWTAGIGVGLCAWGCLVALKVLLGLSLLSFSALRQAGMDEREAEDAVNDFGRSAVGETKGEKDYNNQTTRYLSQDRDDLPEYTSTPSMTHPTTLFPITAKSGSQIGRLPEKSSKGKRWKLEEVERWTMVKRIW